jgi:hypothetical protein
MNKKKTKSRKASKKTHPKTRKMPRKEKPVVRSSRPAKSAAPVPRAQPKPPVPISQALEMTERPSFKINIDRIHGGTVLGDLMVVFPRTREVLKKYGLNLEVEEAGDIYMSLEAFTALKGLKTESVIEELEAASKAPPTPPSAPPIAIPTVA